MNSDNDLYPKLGDHIKIKSYKHDGTLHRTWKDTVTLKNTELTYVGYNYHSQVVEEDGRMWVTHEPAIVFFDKRDWFNVFAKLYDNGIVYYSNLASPFVLNTDILKYVDYELDVKQFPDGSRQLLDTDEYIANAHQWGYSEELDAKIKEQVLGINEDMKSKASPFNDEYIHFWLDQYRKMKRQGK